MVKKLSEVKNFGGTDADGDSLLLECFEDHPAYTAILNHDKFCIVGRKGSGKTAIFKKILTISSYKLFSLGHTFSDYPWHHHDEQRKLGIPEEQCYVHSWTYLCLISLAKILLNKDHSISGNAAGDEVKKIERFILDSYGNRDPDVSRIFSPNVELKLNAELGFDLKVLKGGAKVDTVKMKDLPVIIQEVNSNLKSAIIKVLNPDFDYYILFDELDLGFTKNTNDYALRLIGLLLAAKALNNYAKTNNKRLTIGIFLRDDIYEELKFEDKNKITENNLASVFWDHGANHKTLKGLMEKRFKASLQATKYVKWEEIFDEDHTMTGHQSKYNYITDRTFLRPRDIIKFCNETLLCFQDDSDKLKFENPHLQSAEINYSEYLYRELEDEIHKHVPNYEIYFSILKNLESLNFTKKDFCQAMDQCRSLFVQTDESFEHIARILFDFSVIGYLSTGGRGGGADYVWKYKDQRSKFHETATQFKVHPGFKEVFSLKKFKRNM